MVYSIKSPSHAAVVGQILSLSGYSGGTNFADMRNYGKILQACKLGQNLPLTRCRGGTNFADV